MQKNVKSVFKINVLNERSQEDLHEKAKDILFKKWSIFEYTDILYILQIGVCMMTYEGNETKVVGL